MSDHENTKYDLAVRFAPSAIDMLEDVAKHGGRISQLNAEQIAAMIGRLLAGHAAELDRLRFDLSQEEEARAHCALRRDEARRERDEARAENERLTEAARLNAQGYPHGIAWREDDDGRRLLNIHRDGWDIECEFGPLDADGVHVSVSRAALAAAQEPPATAKTFACGCEPAYCRHRATRAIMDRIKEQEPPAQIASPEVRATWVPTCRALSEPNVPWAVKPVRECSKPEGHDGPHSWEPCPHDNHHFDRSVCACGLMHHYCDDCGQTLEPCSAEPPAERLGCGHRPEDVVQSSEGTAYCQRCADDATAEGDKG